MRVQTTFPTVLRLARVEDRQAIAQMSADALSAYGNYREPIGAWFENPGVFTLVADDHGSVVGFSMLGFVREKPGEPWVADLLAIAVRPESRGHGIGRQLVLEMVDVARRLGAPLGVSEVRLSVADTNQQGIRLFSGTGFLIMDEDHGRYDGGQRALRMRRPLRS